MDLRDQKLALAKPQVARLKALGEGLKIGKVLGNRVLVKPAMPMTEMDRVEKAGTLVIPKAVKDANTPMPSTGVIVAIGDIVGFSYYDDILKEGTAVLFSKYSGADFIIDRVEYKILNVDEIMATLEVEEDSIQLIQNAEELERSE
jgi:chaperonin GroES